MSNIYFFILPAYWIIALVFNTPLDLIVQAVVYGVSSLWIFMKTDRQNSKENFKFKLWVNLSLASIVIPLFIIN